LAEKSSDNVLIDRLRDGDKDALRQIFEDHFTSLCQIAYRVVGDADTAKDMAQEVFLKLWSNRKDLSISKSLAAYLRRAVINTSINFADSKHAGLMRLDKQEISIRDESDAADLTQLQAEADKAIQALPPRTRAVFTLTRFENFTYKEVAEHLNISEKAVEKEVMKALKLLRIALQRFLVIVISAEHLF